ncbi:MAG: LicD family protein [Lachnospiraceae bacterium]|nr:LicD family protein [Lachnospiraceae bacterium]
MKLSTVSLFKNLNSGNRDLIELDDETLKRMQKVILSIAEDIIEVCEANNIHYCLGGGSALGAMRHQGFIPWDDDMDLNMTRRSYERFIPLFTEKYGDRYWIHTPEATSDYGMTLARIRLKGTVLRGREDFANEECGMFVDLFVIENTFDFAPFRYLHGFFSMAMGFLLSCRNFYQNRRNLMALAEGNRQARKIFRIKIGIGRLLSFWSVDRWTHLTVKCYSCCHNHHSRFVVVPSGRNHFFGEQYLRKKFCAVRKLKFEGHDWNVPRDIEGYLKHMYGDYRKIPPASQQEKHVVLDIKF